MCRQSSRCPLRWIQWIRQIRPDQPDHPMPDPRPPTPPDENLLHISLIRMVDQISPCRQHCQVSHQTVSGKRSQFPPQTHGLLGQVKGTFKPSNRCGFSHQKYTNKDQVDRLCKNMTDDDRALLVLYSSKQESLKASSTSALIGKKRKEATATERFPR